ncbi:MAG: phosphodiester glycosidase family protein [Actinomycetota bacterium]
MAIFILSLTSGTLAATGPHDTHAAGRYRRRSVRIAPGLRLIRMVDVRAPNRIRVLSVDPASRMTVDTVLSNNRLPGVERTSAMARRRDAIAAVNGDYSLPWGRPPHVFAEDGILKASPIPWGRAFAISRDEQDVYIRHPRVSIRVTDTRRAVSWRVADWNVGKPRAGKIAAVTPAGAKHLRPPRRACSIRLFPASRRRWDVGQLGVKRDYRVDMVRCAFRRLRLRGGIVLSSRRGGRRAAQIKALRRGDIVPLEWELGWRGVLDVVGGNPTVVERGRVSVTRCKQSFCARHPRTGVGVTAEGKILLVTVDGRRRRSVGMTPLQFGRLFRRLGARWALNLDGGGSTTMVVRNRIVNRPSDPAGERGVSSALLVLPNGDRSEREPAPPRNPQPGASAATSAPGAPTERGENLAPRAEPELEGAAVRAMIRDPASTGGMLDAARAGAFGPATRLPRALRGVVARFRRDRGG